MKTHNRFECCEACSIKIRAVCLNGGVKRCVDRCGMLDFHLEMRLGSDLQPGRTELHLMPSLRKRQAVCFVTPS